MKMELDEAKTLLKAWNEWALSCGADSSEFGMGEPIYGSILDKTRAYLRGKQALEQCFTTSFKIGQKVMADIDGQKRRGYVDSVIVDNNGIWYNVMCSNPNPNLMAPTLFKLLDFMIEPI